MLIVTRMRIKTKKMFSRSALTAQKKEFSIKDFVSKCHQIHMKLQIWSHLLKSYLMENLIFDERIIS